MKILAILLLVLVVPLIWFGFTLDYDGNDAQPEPKASLRGQPEWEWCPPVPITDTATVHLWDDTPQPIAVVAEVTELNHCLWESTGFTISNEPAVGMPEAADCTLRPLGDRQYYGVCDIALLPRYPGGGYSIVDAGGAIIEMYTAPSVPAEPQPTGGGEPP